MRLGDVLAEQLNGTREWTQRLVADLRGDDWWFQPASGMGHAAWLCGHLAVSQSVLVHVRVLGAAPVVDAAYAAHFAIGKPVASQSEHDYPSVESIQDVMRSVHARTLDAIRGMDEALLLQPAYGADGAAHPHYRDKLGVVSHCARHEAFHAGQLASIRRLLGRSFLR